MQNRFHAHARTQTQIGSRSGRLRPAICTSAIAEDEEPHESSPEVQEYQKSGLKFHMDVDMNVCARLHVRSHPPRIQTPRTHKPTLSLFTSPTHPSSSSVAPFLSYRFRAPPSRIYIIATTGFALFRTGSVSCAISRR